MTAKAKEMVERPHDWCDRHNGVRGHVSDPYSYTRAYEAMSKLRQKRNYSLCAQCDWQEIRKAMSTGMAMGEPILKLTNGVAVIADDGGEAPCIFLALGDEKIRLSEADIEKIKEGLEQAKIWLEYGDTHGIAI